MSGNNRVKILALADSPVLKEGKTGFGRVTENILSRWSKQVEVHCWAINFTGWGYERCPFQLFPAGTHDWNSPARLNQFLRHLHDGDYTHVWMLMDPDALSVHGFPQALRKVCKEKNIRVMLYYPVDGNLELEWLEILNAVDAAVAYTEYGRAETRRALCKSAYPIEVIPHGVDDCFKCLPVEERKRARKIEIGTPNGVVDFIKPEDFLIVNVNKNEWRKDLLRSLEILVGLRKENVPAKLILRTSPTSRMGGVPLEPAARQLGLTYGKEWCHIGPLTDEGLVALYNAADLYLTTSLGEGWGLGVTEAMACHCPVAMPKHTSLAEIGQSPIWMPMESDHVCGADTRLRRRAHLQGAIDAIHKNYASKCGFGIRSCPGEGSLKSWDDVASQMLSLLLKTPNVIERYSK